MIVVTIEMWPGGDANHPRKRLLQQVVITNIGGSESIGDYLVAIPKSPEYARSKGIWKQGIVRGFPRKRLGPADLLFRALAACVAQRNPDARVAELGSEPDAEATA